MRGHGAILVGDAGDAHDIADGEPGETTAIVGRTGEKYLQRLGVVAHAQVGAAEIRAQFDDLPSVTTSCPRRRRFWTSPGLKATARGGAPLETVAIPVTTTTGSPARWEM